MREPRAFELPLTGTKPGAPPLDIRREPDAFAVINAQHSAAPAAPLRRGWRATGLFSLGGVFWWASGLFIALGIGADLAASVRKFFALDPRLAWIGSALLAAAALALAAIILRQALALRRLGSIADLQTAAANALLEEDDAGAQRAAEKLVVFCEALPHTAQGRARLAEARRSIIDGVDLLKLAERELILPIDAEVKRVIGETVKRVSIVTAISPRAVFDVLFVLAQSAMMVRRIAVLYGGIPSASGNWRLARAVLTQLAMTGGIAAGESMLSQVLGAGLAGRLSARLGEGVLNGVLAARAGAAAIRILRPLPFIAEPAPGVAELAAGILSSAPAKTAEGA